MTIYKNYCEEKIEVPPEIDAFIKEYEILCKKHNLMIISEGEPIIVIEYKEDLWGIKKSIANELIK